MNDGDRRLMKNRPLIPALLRVAILTGGASILTGCMVGPDYVRPAAPMSAAFKESEGWKPAQPKDIAPRGNWWEAFGDPALDALEREVDLANPTVQAAEARVREARAATQAARAGLFPALTGNVNALRSARGNTSSSGNGSSTQSVANAYNAALDLSWEVDLWGRTRRGVEASTATAEWT